MTKEERDNVIQRELKIITALDAIENATREIRTQLMYLTDEVCKATRKDEPSNSEKPNNCDDLQDWKDRMRAEAIVTEPTISKMEQVDEPYIDIETGILHWCGWKYKRIYEDEPQTDCPWK